MSKLSLRNRELYETSPELLVSVTIRIPQEIHQLILELTKAIVVSEIKYSNTAEYENELSKGFSKWRNDTEEGRAAGLIAFNIAVKTSQLDARKYLRDEFLRKNPNFSAISVKKRTRSPTGYSRETVGRVVTEALEVAKLKLRNRYCGGSRDE